MKGFSILLAGVMITLASPITFAQSESAKQSGEQQPPQTNRRQLEGQNRQGKNRGEKIKRRLAQMDTDKDQRISRDEWKRRAKVFDRLDADHDGFITREEINARRGFRRQRNNPNSNEPKPPSS